MILIKNGIILTLENENIIEKGDIVLKGSRIEYAGPALTWTDKFDRIIDASNKLVMPGFVNSHTHLAMTLMRGIADDLPLEKWLKNIIFPIEQKLTREEVYYGTLLALIESIRTGTTTITDFYFYEESVFNAVKEIGIRANIGFSYASKPGLNKIILKKAESFFEKYNNCENGRITVSLAPHSPYTCDLTLLKETALLANKIGSIVQIHLHETKKEVDDYLKKHKKTPIEKLEEIGFFNARVNAAHCVWMKDNDIEILKKNNAGVTLNPQSNLKLGSGIPDVAKLIRKGINVSIGTDGASSNNNLAIIEDLRLASLLAKGTTLNPSELNAFSALRMATVNGANNLGFNDVGILKTGFKADLIIIDATKANLMPLTNPYSLIVYSMYPEDVETVIIDGKVIMENRKLLTINEEQIKETFKEKYHKIAKLKRHI
jgi:5-methylthioadenosine/S-adenosylhomocysteine deaminase